MNFTTHNTEQIDVNGTHKQGHIDAKYAELVALFGEPITPTPSDEIRLSKTDAEWNLRFEDGEVATIYNWRNGKNWMGEDGIPTKQIRDWNIGGNSKCVVDRVQIALDLYRESKEEQPKGEGDEAFKTAHDMIETIRATKGQAYLDTVEIAALIRKRAELLAHLTHILVDADIIPKKAAKVVMDIDAQMGARIIGKYARAANISTSDKGAEEIMNWVDKIHEYEQKGAEAIMKSVLEDDDE